MKNLVLPAIVLYTRQAGLSNWQIITASTVGGAKALGKDGIFGSIRRC